MDTNGQISAVQMGSYFTDRFEAIVGLPAAIAQAPLFFLVAFSIGGGVIWAKYKFIGRSLQHSIDSTTHGHRAPADRRTVRHETGIGTSDVLVMRPALQTGAIWFALFFFGGGAVFYFLVVLQAPDATGEDWWVFAGLAAFTISAMFLIEFGYVRIYVYDERLERRRMCHRRQVILFSDIASVAPHGKSYSRGVVVYAASGGKMPILASFSGYREVIARVGQRDPKLRMYASVLAKQKVR